MGVNDSIPRLEFFPGYTFSSSSSPFIQSILFLLSSPFVYLSFSIQIQIFKVLIRLLHADGSRFPPSSPEPCVVTRNERVKSFESELSDGRNAHQEKNLKVFSLSLLERPYGSSSAANPDT